MMIIFYALFDNWSYDQQVRTVTVMLIHFDNFDKNSRKNIDSTLSVYSIEEIYIRLEHFSNICQTFYLANNFF